jgi:hypothetical protein
MWHAYVNFKKIYIYFYYYNYSKSFLLKKHLKIKTGKRGGKNKESSSKPLIPLSEKIKINKYTPIKQKKNTI